MFLLTLQKPNKQPLNINYCTYSKVLFSLPEEQGPNLIIGIKKKKVI